MTVRDAVYYTFGTIQIILAREFGWVGIIPGIALGFFLPIILKKFDLD